jgi:hypothetical protein
MAGSIRTKEPKLQQMWPLQSVKVLDGSGMHEQRCYVGIPDRSVLMYVVYLLRTGFFFCSQVHMHHLFKIHF